MRRKTKNTDDNGVTIDKYMDTISEVAMECQKLLHKGEYLQEGSLNLYLSELKKEFKEEVTRMIFELRQKQCLTCRRK